MSVLVIARVAVIPALSHGGHPQHCKVPGQPFSGLVSLVNVVDRQLCSLCSLSYCFVAPEPGALTLPD